MKTNLQIKFNDFIAETKIHGQDYQEAFKRVLNSGWYILGEEVESFEKEFAQFLGSKYCIGVGNGLEALQISLMALGVGQDDEVITTPISAVATTLAILAVGASPVFVDTDKNGLINADLIEKAITKKTKAILPVHLYGQAVDLKTILRLCKKYHLQLIEDACQAHGSTALTTSGVTKKLGTFGIFGCFSFYPTKNLGALGDGGVIVTDNPKLALICHETRDYGQSSKYIHSRFGVNSRLDELQAAILRVKLKKLARENKKRVIRAKRYIKNLTSNIELCLPENIDDCNFHQFVIRVKNREVLQQKLKEHGIPTLIHYPITIPDQPFLKNHLSVIASPKGEAISIPEARKFVRETLSLPIHPLLSPKQIDYIALKINSYSG